jgi:hypothetical protein
MSVPTWQHPLPAIASAQRSALVAGIAVTSSYGVKGKKRRREMAITMAVTTIAGSRRTCSTLTTRENLHRGPCYVP